MKPVKLFEEFINESIVNEKKELYQIMRFQNGRTKELYGPATIEELAYRFNLDDAIKQHHEFGNMDIGGNIRGKKFKVEDIETIEDLVKILNFAQELKEKTPKPKNTYEVWDN